MIIVSGGMMSLETGSVPLLLQDILLLKTMSLPMLIDSVEHDPRIMLIGTGDRPIGVLQ
jgi:hypothetical protein